MLQGLQPLVSVQRFARVRTTGNVGLQPAMRTGGTTQRSTAAASRNTKVGLSGACSTKHWAPVLTSLKNPARHHKAASSAWNIGALPDASSNFGESLPATRAHAVEAIPEVAVLGWPAHDSDRSAKRPKAFRGIRPEPDPVTPLQIFGFSAKAFVLVAAAVFVWKKLVPVLKKGAPALKAAISLFAVSLIWEPVAKVKDFFSSLRQSRADQSQGSSRTLPASATLQRQYRPAIVPEAVEVGTVASAAPPRIKPQHGSHQQQASSERRSNGVMVAGGNASPLAMDPRVTSGDGSMASQGALKVAVCAAVLGGAALLGRESSSPGDGDRRVVDS